MLLDTDPKSGARAERHLAAISAVLVAGALGLFAVAPAQAQAGFCLAIDGFVLTQSGVTKCAADPGMNFAYVAGESSSDYATGGNGNFALVVGDESSATAGVGNNNFAFVFGNDSKASAYEGDGNRAFVFGSHSSAFAAVGNDNTAITIGTDSSASAHTGNRNTAFALADTCTASVFGASDLFDICP